MTAETTLINGVAVPRFLYGTAWKENETQRLTALALQQGFRGIDTANQRRHYFEAAVGDAIAASTLRREELFLQTKFTYRHGQDERLPYDANAPIAQQVEQSFASSLDHLRTGVIDSYVLHSPMRTSGIDATDWEAWRAMEALHDRGQARLLGVSNISVDQLQVLCRGARVKPSLVQNRCYAARGWDRRVRQFCAANGMVYQGFSLLTGNRDVLAREVLIEIARRHGRSVSQIVFRFALDIGMIPLTGTSNADHMHADLDVFNFQLDERETGLIERIAG